MKRIFLFIVTNLAVLVVLGLVIFAIEHVFGVARSGRPSAIATCRGPKWKPSWAMKSAMSRMGIG